MNHPHEDDDLDRALFELWRAADAGTRAPADFDARLFARLEREAPRTTNGARVPAAAWLLPTLPWWVRAAGERHVALALALAAAVLAWPTWWLAGAVAAGDRGASLARGLDQALASLFPALFAPLAAPRVALITAACLAPAIAWASYRLALAAERWARRAAHGRAVPARHA